MSPLQYETLCVYISRDFRLRDNNDWKDTRNIVCSVWQCGLVFGHGDIHDLLTRAQNIENINVYVLDQHCQW